MAETRRLLRHSEWMTMDFSRAHALARTVSLEHAVAVFWEERPPRSKAKWFAHFGSKVWMLETSDDVQEFICLLRFDHLDNVEMCSEDIEMLQTFYKKWKDLGTVDETFAAEVNELGEIGVYGIERDVAAVHRRIRRLVLSA